jgi:hypothetical protein
VSTLLQGFLATLSRRRVGQPAGLPARRPLLALPAPPGADLGPVCPHCGHRHPPPLGRRRWWSTVIDGSAEEGRPRPLSREAAAPLGRPNPWRHHA